VSALLDSATGALFGVAQALCALALLLAVIWLLRRTRMGSLPFGAHKARALAVEERIPIDLRSGLVIVRVEGRRLLLATSDSGPARLVSELTPAEPGAKDPGPHDA
jgi:flagellar biogenesis protein FliO